MNHCTLRAQSTEYFSKGTLSCLSCLQKDKIKFLLYDI